MYLWLTCDIVDDEKPPKKLRFIASAKDNLSEMPDDVKYEVGSNLWEFNADVRRRIRSR